jgi:hypothetical protein
VCGTHEITYKLKDGKSHTTTGLRVGAKCTVTQSKGPSQRTNVTITGSAGRTKASTKPPRGIGFIPDHVLLMVFTNPAGTLVVDLLGPSPTPSTQQALPLGVDAPLLLPPDHSESVQKPGPGRSPLVAPPPTPGGPNGGANAGEGGHPSSGAASQPSNGKVQAAAPLDGGPTGAGITILIIVGLILLAIAALLVRKAMKRLI